MGRSVHPQLRMKRLFRFLLAAICFAAVACTDYQVDIDRLEDRVGELETSKIANISQQISQINASIPVLQSSSAELKNMINSVSETVDGYGTAITKNEAGLTNLKNEISNTIETLRAGIEASQDEDKQQMLDALNAAKAELEAQIAALKTDTQSEFDQMNEVLANLKEKDASIEARIDSLKAFVNEELTSQKDWATKTFATLEQQQALQDEISDVKGSITALQTSMAELEKRLTEDYTKAIQEAVSGLQTSMSELEKRVTEAYVKAIQEAVSNLDSKIPASADEITKAYTAAIATAKSEITTAYEAKLASSIEALEKNLKTWVNETLKSYWTISETQSELRELKTGLQNQLDRHSAYITGIHNVLGDTGSLSKTIVELIKDNAAAITKNENSIKELSAQLDTAKANIRTQYKAAIADAVKEDGVVDKLIAKRIDEYNTELQKTITSIKTDITGLKTDVGNLQKNMKTLRDSVVTVWTKLDKFIDGRIQSLTYIPVSMDGEYLAGNTSCQYAYGNFVMNFHVNPASMVKDIKSLDQISATVKHVEYVDKEISSCLPVKVLSFKTHEYAGILEVTIAANEVFKYGTHRAAISVSVKDLTNKYYDVASEFVYVNAHPFFVRYTTIGNDKAFNPYKFNFHKDVTNYTAFDDAKMRESLLGHYFVDAPTETVTLDVQFAASDRKVNAQVDTLVFGEIINPKYYDRPSVGDHLNQVALKTGKDAFSNSTALKYADLFFLDVREVETFENMFLNCKSLNFVGFDKTDVKKVTTMENMFNNCDGLTTVSLKDWKTESLKTALNMFIGCDNLTEVDLTGWNVKKLTNLQGMFADCPKLKKVTLDWKEFSSDAINLYATFRSTAITEVKAALGIKVYTTNKLFNSCTALTKVDLAGSVKMVKGTSYSYADLGHMFDGCSALTSVDLTGWTFDDMADLNNMFNGCSALQTITLDGWKLKSGTITTSMFDSCTALTTVNIKNSDSDTVALIKAALTSSNKSSVNVVVQ